jgi:hypothetical protein
VASAASSSSRVLRLRTGADDPWKHPSDQARGRRRPGAN